jgi:hypothetical protein
VSSTVILACLMSPPVAVVAQDTTASESDTARRVRKEVFLGIHAWDDVSTLEPAAVGRFDSEGFNLGAAFHWRRWQLTNSSMLVGFDVALFSNESSIRHVRDDLIARGLYVTPSVKWVRNSASGVEVALDFGLGFYGADIAEVEIFKGGGYVESEVWEDTTLGGYIGGSVDFSDTGDRRRGFSVSAKIHVFDLGQVNDEKSSALIGTLGSNAGSLSGPVFTIQGSYHWY